MFDGGANPANCGRVPANGRCCRRHVGNFAVSTLVFDTHAFVKELTDAGMPEAQAEVLVRTQARLIDEQLATKRDLKELELRLKHDLTVRLGTMMVVAIGLVATLVKLL